MRIQLVVGDRCSTYLKTNRIVADDLQIPPKASVELIQGVAKIVMQNTDLLRIQSSAATSVAAYVSVVDAIS